MPTKNGAFGTVLEVGERDMRVRLDDGAEKHIDLAGYGHIEDLRAAPELLRRGPVGKSPRNSTKTDQIPR